MKDYIAPVVDLLYLNNEDILTSSDNYLSDIFFNTNSSSNGSLL